MLTQALFGNNNQKGRLPGDTGLSLSIVIPTWNGLHLLKKFLPSVVRAAEHYQRETGSEWEILLADDGSTDGTRSYFEREPINNLRVIALPENRGFAPACNAGFREARFELIGLVNNDVELHPDYFIRQSIHFRDPEVFAVTAKVYDPGTKIFNTGGRYGRFRRGFWSVYFNYDSSPEEEVAPGHEHFPLLSFYAIGGFSTYRKSGIRELGGFLEILSPFHWEDVDLSYRGWKRGWKVTYEPASLAWHQASSTINAHYKSAHVDSVSLRNRLLFHWINIHSRPMISRHLLSLLAMCILKTVALDRYFLRAVREALGQLPEVRRLRKLEKEQSRRSDKQIIAILNDFYRSAPVRVYMSRQEVLKNHQDAR